MAEVLRPSQSDITPEVQTLPRREFLKTAGKLSLGLGVVAGSALGGNTLLRNLRQEYLDGVGQSRAQTLFNRGVMHDWHKLAAFPDLLQLDPSVKIKPSIFLPEQRANWPSDKFTVAVRPLVVYATWLRNIADYDQSTQDDLNRALPDIPRRLLAFYPPEGNKLVYCDAGSNAGLIAPLTDNGFFERNRLPVQDVNIKGRELRGDTVYPFTKDTRVEFKPDDNEQAKLDELRQSGGYNSQEYTSEYNQAAQNTSNYQAIEHIRVYGHSTTVDTTVDLSNMVRDFNIFGKEPVVVPDP